MAVLQGGSNREEENKSLAANWINTGTKYF